MVTGYSVNLTHGAFLCGLMTLLPRKVACNRCLLVLGDSLPVNDR